MKKKLKKEHAKANVIMVPELAIRVAGGEIDTDDIVRQALERLPIEQEGTDGVEAPASSDDGQ